MPHPNVLILRAPGINCDEETAYAWQQVGAKPTRLHSNQLCETPALLKNYQVLTIPGGFSYGDDIASGKILANQMKHHLADELAAFIDRGGLVAGICNGFQVLVRLGLVPGPGCATPVTLALNDSGRYEDRWVHLRAETDRCPFLRKGEIYHLPVAHGEGRIVTADGDAGAAALAAAGRVALRYVALDRAGETSHDAPGFPENPNGSVDNIAGLIDSTGRVFGLMPHPERCMFVAQVPAAGPDFSPENEVASQPDGLRMFAHAVASLK